MPITNISTDSNFNIPEGQEPFKPEVKRTPTEQKTSEVGQFTFNNEDWKNLTGAFEGLTRDEAWDKLEELQGTAAVGKAIQQIGNEQVEQQSHTGAYKNSPSKYEDFIILAANTLGMSQNSVRLMVREGRRFGDKGVGFPKKNVELQPLIYAKIQELEKLYHANAASGDQWGQEAINDLFNARVIEAERRR